MAHRVTIECHLFTLCLRLLKASTSVALGIRHIAGIMVQPLYETALKRWLLVVAALRMLAVFIGIFAPNKLKSTVFDRRPDLVSPLLGRLFAAWTIMTCALCVACSLDTNNETLYATTLFSFVVAWVFFVSEVFICKTVTLRGAMSPFIVATVSAVWLALGYVQ